MKLSGKAALAFISIVFLLVSGCATRCVTRLEDQPAAETLEALRSPFAEVPVTVEVLNFRIDSVKSQAGNVTAEDIRRYYSLAVPNALYRSLGNRHVFSDVFRASHADDSADFIVSGTYDYVFRVKRSFVSYFVFPAIFTVDAIGTTHLKVTEAKTGAIILDKTYVEEHTDRGDNDEMLSVHLLHPGHIEAMSFDIKKAMYARMRKDL